ncbi:hypothetical protein C2845_PM05G37520 [Panicum miliaceum]|uniref:Cathepsin propeptide inhibitor domain-containing protein n=1 Tax=Panicum miliaceum TaxID=4540 RepID=A0A3L6T523_PANMI|nr:hypothetical protein C2845_PM05G37520 [Panicum miliaceum]
MARVAESRLLRAARNAALASRTAAAAASRAATMARAAAAAASLGSGVRTPLNSCPTRGRGEAFKMPRGYFCPSDYEHVPDDAKSPTDKDVESDEAIWALYERWCKGFDKKRDRAEMSRRFKIFKHYALDVHYLNTHLPPDPEEAAIYIQKRREAKLLLSKGEDVSHFDEWYLPMVLGPFADGGDPCIDESSMRLLKAIEKMEKSSAVEDISRVVCLGKYPETQTLNEMNWTHQIASSTIISYAFASPCVPSYGSLCVLSYASVTSFSLSGHDVFHIYASTCA